MIRKEFSAISFLFAMIAVLLALRAPARAAIQTDPIELYQTMRKAFDQGNAQGWTFRNQTYYLATIIDAGRAYALFRPQDPTYAELASLTLRVGSLLHYNPLTNQFAAPWYVREAANYVVAHGDANQVADAKELLRRIDAVTDPVLEARFADEDASANVRAYPNDADAAIARVGADWHAYTLTKDSEYRALAFEHAAEPAFPVASLPNPWGNDLLGAARAAAANVNGYRVVEVVSAKAILDHLKSAHPLPIIETVVAQSHDAYLTTLAPADEYFGQARMSILGMKNDIRRIGQLLDAGYGSRESSDLVFLADAIDQLHRVYPKDRDLPQLLLQTYELGKRIHTADAERSTALMRTILTIEYNDTSEAQRIL